MTNCTYREHAKKNIDYIRIRHDYAKKQWIYDYIRKTFDVNNDLIFTSRIIASGSSMIEMLMNVDVIGIKHDRNVFIFVHIKKLLNDKDMNLLDDACRRWKIEMLVSDDDSV